MLKLHVLMGGGLESGETGVQTPEGGDRVAVFGFSRGAALARKFAAMILREDAGREVAFLGVFDTVAAMDGIHREGEKISTDDRVSGYRPARKSVNKSEGDSNPNDTIDNDGEDDGGDPTPPPPGMSLGGIIEDFVDNADGFEQNLLEDFMLVIDDHLDIA